MATVTINITPVNDAPIGVSDSFSTPSGVTLNELIGVLTNDTDAESSPITAILMAAPVNGTVALSADGTFTYIPTPGFYGTDTFTYLPNDGSLSGAVTTVTIEVLAGVLPNVDPIDPPGPIDPPVDPPIDPPEPETEPIEETDSTLPALPNLGRVWVPPRTHGSFTQYDVEELARYIDLLDERRALAVLRTIVAQDYEGLILEEEDLRRLRISAGAGIAFDAKYLWKQLDDLTEPKSIFDDLTVTVGAITSIGTLGYIFWSLRGGALVALALSQLPSWRMIDPLPVLETYSTRKGKKDEGGFEDFF